MSIILRAKFVAPIDRPILRDGSITIENGRITAINSAREARAGSNVEDLGDVVLLPGLVNAHAHLDLSLARAGGATSLSFGEWLLSVRSTSRATTDDPNQPIIDAMREGVAQSLKFGVTTIGDISANAPVVREALAALPRRPRIVSFGEVLGLAKRRFRVDELLTQAIDASAASESLRIGISPHAPYTVDRPGYETCLRVARERKLPLLTHLAESRDERAFLEAHSGPFRELWERIGSWDEPVETFRGSPIEFAHAIGLLDYPSALAHVNYCDDRELDLLARGSASVIYCPRTHRYFGHPPHRWREMLAAGVNVAIGTDSCASSSDLNLLDDLRLMHQIAPEVPIETLWEMATLRGARALWMQDEIGSLTPGKRADLVAFAVRDDDPLREILESKIAPVRVWRANP